MSRHTSAPPSDVAAAVGPPGARDAGWWRITLAGGALLTLFDAFLIQQKKAFFTGGFLAVDHAEGARDVLGFLAASFLADAAAVGALAVIALWLLGPIRLTPAARGLAVLSAALAPLVIADFLSYRLVAYLGDAFDLALMFDLTGRQPSEMLAVASPHLVAPVLVIIGLGTVAGSLVWALNRFRSRLAGVAHVPGRTFATAAGLLLVGLAGTTMVRTYSDVLDNGLRRKPSGKALGSIARAVTDFDRDGYGIGGAMPDPAPFDSRIFPYAIDVPGNGIDENGVGGDLPAGPPYTEPATIPGPWRHTPDVVLIVLESFRADAVGAVLNGKPVTPALDALARAGVSVSSAFSHNGYTTQSRRHLMSGSLAGLREGRTLIDDFKAKGYEVGYFSGQDESFGGPAYDVGFNRADVAYDARQDRARRYSTFTTPGSLAVPFDVVIERIAGFLAERRHDRPLFLHVNFHDTHYPYHHAGIEAIVSDTVLREGQITPARARELREMYLNTAANVDRAVAATLETVRRHLPATPAVIVTADHGESLFDEGFLGHGYALNDVQTRIPVVVSGLPVEIDEPFGQMELRDAIAAALSSPSDLAPPQVRSRAAKRVFQYLGSLDHPRQIAFTANDGRTTYDFRTDRVQIAGGVWRRPGDLGDDEERFLDLVHFWERMVLARRNVTRDPEE